uniref:Uncharacterized protein n=4 Tax=Meloidogyne TaxID=189290 RepID=A0A6V7XZA4_MELEN|nr:unnamed protein product [Meloidogyne enterolobii]CAD2204571.1 unnamed protein product [Meloidogyne enterolobii]
MSSSTFCFLIVVALIAQIVDLAPAPDFALDQPKQFRVKRTTCYKYNIHSGNCGNPSCPSCPASSSMSSGNPDWADCCY